MMTFFKTHNALVVGEHLRCHHLFFQFPNSKCFRSSQQLSSEPFLQALMQAVSGAILSTMSSTSTHTMTLSWSFRRREVPVRHFYQKKVYVREGVQPSHAHCLTMLGCRLSPPVTSLAEQQHPPNQLVYHLSFLFCSFSFRASVRHQAEGYPRTQCEGTFVA